MKSVKIGISLFLVFVASFVPILCLFIFGGPIFAHLRYAYSINNLANFFIYLVVDEEFRAKLKAMCKRSRE